MEIVLLMCAELRIARYFERKHDQKFWKKQIKSALKQIEKGE